MIVLVMATMCRVRNMNLKKIYIRKARVTLFVCVRAENVLKTWQGESGNGKNNHIF